jgi:hypothetical protein
MMQRTIYGEICGSTHVSEEICIFKDGCCKNCNHAALKMQAIQKHDAAVFAFSQFPAHNVLSI